VRRTRPEGPEHDLDAEEAFDKPLRVVVTKRVSLRDGINSLVISWLGTRGGQSAKNEFL
jgi:hypothetical protein